MQAGAAGVLVAVTGAGMVAVAVQATEERHASRRKNGKHDQEGYRVESLAPPKR